MKGRQGVQIMDEMRIEYSMLDVQLINDNVATDTDCVCLQFLVCHFIATAASLLSAYYTDIFQKND